VGQALGTDVDINADCPIAVSAGLCGSLSRTISDGLSGVFLHLASAVL